MNVLILVRLFGSISKRRSLSAMKFGQVNAMEVIEPGKLVP